MFDENGKPFCKESGLEHTQKGCIKMLINDRETCINEGYRWMKLSQTKEECENNRKGCDEGFSSGIK